MSAEVVTTEAPEQTVDPLAAHQEVSRRVRTIRDIRRQLAIIEATYHDQIAEVEESLGNVYRLAIQEVDLWWAQERERLDHDIAHQEACIRPLVRLLVAEEPSKRKSVSTVAGVAGFRTLPGKLQVDDAAACMAWLEEHAPDLIRTKREPDLRAIKARLAEGELFPGVVLTEGGEAFYVDVTTEAPR